jgi:dienelactone hydrolase
MQSSTVVLRILFAFALMTIATTSPDSDRATTLAEESTETRPELAFQPKGDFEKWQTELRERLRKIMAVPVIEDHSVKSVIQPDSETDRYTMVRIEFEAEPGQKVPGYLLRPKNAKGPLPVMICLQGHSPGMHISVGRAKTDRDRESIRGGRDIAVQAIDHGWAALVIEQRGFGERAVEGKPCGQVALEELLKGRPLTGQRVFDVMRAVDFIATQDDLDSERIGCMGNSTGGTVAFYAACMDERLRLAVVSCSFGTYESTWLYKKHCACGYLPGVLKVADMPDLAGLIAPRDLVLVAGKEDHIARFDGVEAGFQHARRCFSAAGCADRVTLLAAEGGHQFYPELAWPVIQDTLTDWGVRR